MAPKITLPLPSQTGQFVLGAAHFDKISAVEGLAPSRTMLKTFQEMDQRGLSAEERISHLKAKYGQTPAAR